MRDKKFLAWLHERLRHQHGENPNFDYMWRLREIIGATPPDQRYVAPPIMTAEELTAYAEEFDIDMKPTGEIVDQQSTS